MTVQSTSTFRTLPQSHYSETYPSNRWSLFCEQIGLYIEQEGSKSTKGLPLTFYEWTEWSALCGNLSSIKCLSCVNNARIASELWGQIFDLEQTIHDKTTKDKIISASKLATIWNRMQAHYVDLNMNQHAEQALRQYFSCWTYAGYLGSQKANRIAGICYQKGIGVAHCPSKAFSYILEASRQGDSLAMFYRGQWFEQKEENLATAIDYYNFAAAGDCVEARYKLGKMYLYGIGVKCSKKKAIEYFSKGDNEIYGPSLYFLGKIHRKSSPEEAKRYFHLASARGLKKASFALGKMFEAEKNFNKAFRQYFNSAIRGIAKGQYKIACWYVKGIGVFPNKKEAVIWCKKAAEQNYQPAVQLLTKITKENEPTSL